MPAKFSNSSVFKWPSKEEVEESLRKWATNIKAQFPQIHKIGYFGSYATGKYGVGSDLDIIVVVESSEKPFLERPLDFDTTSLPVPADLLVYTRQEFEKLTGRFAQVLKEEVIWIIP